MFVHLFSLIFVEATYDFLHRLVFTVQFYECEFEVCIFPLLFYDEPLGGTVGSLVMFVLEDLILHVEILPLAGYLKALQH